MDSLISRHVAIDKIMGEPPEAHYPSWYAEIIQNLPSAQPEQSLEIQDILEYLDTVLHPIVSPDHWNVYSELYDMISMLPPAQPEQQWVPVTERLPEDGAEVWVTTDMLFEVTRARWHKDSNLWCHPYNSDCLLVLRPIAWMEMSLPEPYKGGVESHYCPNCGAEMRSVQNE